MSVVSEEHWSVAVTLGEGGPAAGIADAVANFLWEAGATGLIEEDAGGGGRLRAFFPPGVEPDGIQERLIGYLADLRGLGLPVAAPAVLVEREPDRAWAEAWREHFRPLPVGRRLLVCPPWESPPEAMRAGPAGPRLTIRIEPGRAFGTGGHASTQGCLELLERVLAERPVGRVIDVGTGSGVLAIAAAVLGVPVVEAFDLDPDAVASTLANAARNGVADRVGVTMATLEGWDGPPGDLVLANLIGATHLAAAATLGRYVTPSGRLIAGGLLVHETPAVVAAFVPEGFRLAELTEREGWATLCLDRRI